jgi:hypothetical protein
MMTRRLAFISRAINQAVLVECTDNLQERKPPESKLDMIVLSPENTKVVAGEAVEFTARGYNAAGMEIPISAIWKLSVLDVKIGALGVLRGNSVVFTWKFPGKMMITVESSGVQATVQVEVMKAKPAYLRLAVST